MVLLLGVVDYLVYGGELLVVVLVYCVLEVVDYFGCVLLFGGGLGLVVGLG